MTDTGSDFEWPKTAFKISQELDQFPTASLDITSSSTTTTTKVAVIFNSLKVAGRLQQWLRPPHDPAGTVSVV